MLCQGNEANTNIIKSLFSIVHNHRGGPYFFSEWSSLFLPNLYICLWPEKMQNHVTSFLEITMENDWWLLILRNHSQCTTSTSLMKNCSMVKKILIILSEKKVYYIFLFLKVNQCTFKQKETILKLGNPLKSKSKFTKSKIVWGALPWTHWGPSDSRSNFLSIYNSKISPFQNL
jgi:hypothetical protein